MADLEVVLVMSVHRIIRPVLAVTSATQVNSRVLKQYQNFMSRVGGKQYE